MVITNFLQEDCYDYYGPSPVQVMVVNYRHTGIRFFRYRFYGKLGFKKLKTGW